MLKSLWKDPVWAAVIATGITAALAAMGTFVFGFWPAMATALKVAWDFVNATTLVSNWVLGLLALPTVLAIFLISVAIWGHFSESSNEEASWLAYSTDTFFGLRWRWRYHAGSIDRLVTFCPNCDYQVFPRNASSYSAIDRISFKCDSCQQYLGSFDDSHDEILSKVERFIQQKLRNGTWKAES